MSTYVPGRENGAGRRLLFNSIKTSRGMQQKKAEKHEKNTKRAKSAAALDKGGRLWYFKDVFRAG